MKREYSLDLLKIAAMMGVVAHHILNDGASIKVDETCQWWGGVMYCFEQLWHCLCYCAVNVFVMATGYIMCRLGFKYIRIFKLWRQVVGYSLAICALATCCGVQVGLRDWLNACFPILTNQYWFFTQYFALFFTIPFLNRLLEHLSKKELAILLGTGFGLLSCAALISGTDLFATKWGYCYLWFMYLYILGAAIWKLELVKRIQSWQAWAALLVGGIVSAGGAIGAEVLPRLIGCGGRVGDLAYSYTSPSLVLEAVASFVIFGKIEIKAEWLKRIIVFLAPSTFIVYIVHMNGLFRQIVGWQTMFAWLSDFGWCASIWGSAMYAVVVYVAIAAVDCLRRVVFCRAKN